MASRRGELQRQVTKESDTFEKVRAGNGTGSCTATAVAPISAVFHFNHWTD